jgi:polysaccharide export outer membrane protein
MLEREGRRATAPFGALVYEPSNNIWTHPGDTIYLYREPQTFLAFGAVVPAAGGSVVQTGGQGQFTFDAWRISLAEGIGKAGGLNDGFAEPAAVFLYRGEIREVAERLGIDCSRFPGPIIPVIYNVNLRNPEGYFLATKFPMRNKDVLYVANATSVEISKALQFFRLTVATVNDPIVAAQNAYSLNILARTNNRFPVGLSFPIQ